MAFAIPLSAVLFSSGGKTIPSDPVAPLAWVSNPATASVGGSPEFTWAGGVAPYRMVVVFNAAEVDYRLDPSTNYLLDTDTHGAGVYRLTLTDGAGTSLTTNCTVS